MHDAPTSDLTVTVEWLEERYPALIAFFRHRLPVSLHVHIHDLAQETLMAVWTAASRGEEAIRDPLSYLLQVARNKCHDVHRWRGRRREIPVDDLESEIGERLGPAGAEEQLLENERREAIRTALGVLGRQEREVLYLRYYEQLGNRATAERLGISPEECSRIKYRALDRLKSRLDHEFGRRK